MEVSFRQGIAILSADVAEEKAEKFVKLLGRYVVYIKFSALFFSRCRMFQIFSNHFVSL